MKVISAMVALFGVAHGANVLGLHKYSFDDFLSEFGKSYPNKSEYNLRKTLFENRVDSFVKHNMEGNKYLLNVNKFADMSDAEINQYRGFNANAKKNLKLGKESAPYRGTAVADDLDWRTKGAVSPVKDQGGCGSCWAFGSAETLESHWQINHGSLPILSPQQIVDCAPNDDHCGGTGGCSGSIPELAYDWIKDHGLAAEKDYPYQGSDGQCKTSASAAANVTGYVGVTSNNYTAVMEALNVGPLAITVSAGPWMFYGGGVFTGCTKSGDSTELDHVVQLVGYGEDNNTPYWLVRNSWGSGWGEGGYIKIERHTDGDYCGTDNKPADGTGCNGGPSTVEVCGSCGILYDAVYPKV